MDDDMRTLDELLGALNGFDAYCDPDAPVRVIKARLACDRVQAVESLRLVSLLAGRLADELVAGGERR